MWSIYILLCSDGSLYTGSTNDVQKRFKVHQERKATKSEALKRERQIKGWSREKKIRILKLVF